MTQDQLLDLANTERDGTATGIQRALSVILQARPHLHSIGIMTNGEVRLTQERSIDRVRTLVREIGPSYVFKNPNHPLAGDPLLDQVFIGTSRED
jgi:hypothetical protein